MYITGIRKINSIENLKPKNYYHSRGNRNNNGLYEQSKNKEQQQEKIFQVYIEESQKVVERDKKAEDEKNVRQINQITVENKPLMQKHVETTQARLQKAQKAYNMENKSARTKMEETNNESIIEEVQAEKNEVQPKTKKEEVKEFKESLSPKEEKSDYDLAFEKFERMLVMKKARENMENMKKAKKENKDDELGKD